MKKRRKPGERLTHQEWDKIQAGFEVGERVVDLAKKYNVASTTISRRAKSHGWKVRGALKDKAIAAASSHAEESLKRRYLKAVEEETEYDYKVNRLLKDTILKGIKIARARYIALETHNPQDWHEIADPNDNSKTIRVLLPRSGGKTSYELNMLQQAMKSVQDSQRAVLRITEINPFDDTEVDMNSIERLRALMTPIDFKDIDFSQYHDEQEAAGEEDSAPVHSNNTQGQ